MLHSLSSYSTCMHGRTCQLLDMPAAPPPQMDRGLGWEGNRFVPIRRNSILYDGYDQLGRWGERLKGRVRVQLINAHGEAEAGVDGGGLFKDFLEDLLREGFSPQYGLFKATANQQLYPDPAAVGTVPEAAAMLEFLGRMLAKAMFEGILVELPLAGAWCPTACCLLPAARCLHTHTACASITCSGHLAHSPTCPPACMLRANICVICDRMLSCPTLPHNPQLPCRIPLLSELLVRTFDTTV